jgi:hypothetical protein
MNWVDIFLKTVVSFNKDLSRLIDITHRESVFEPYHSVSKTPVLLSSYLPFTSTNFPQKFVELPSLSDEYLESEVGVIEFTDSVSDIFLDGVFIKYFVESEIH